MSITLSPADIAAHAAGSFVRPAPVRPPGVVGALFDALLVEPSRPVTRIGIQRAITEATYSRHGVTHHAEVARAKDAHVLGTVTARIPYTSLTQGRFARLLASAATS